jgi:LysR family transcriptional regulator, regulator of gene expression of beta-lactamase
LELTAQGKALLTGITASFDAIAQLTESVAAMQAGPVLTVGVGQALAVNWLIPRMASFYRDHPGIEVRIATGGATRPVRDDWTCTIRRADKAWPGYTSELLFPSAVLPVCTPAIAASLASVDDLRRAVLIRVSNMPNDWPYWFALAGHIPVRAAAEAFFESNAMAIQAALDGAGVAVAQTAYVSNALTARRLVAPFPIVAVKRENWLLEYRPARQEEPALIAFRDWVRAEANCQRHAESALL